MKNLFRCFGIVNRIKKEYEKTQSNISSYTSEKLNATTLSEKNNWENMIMEQKKIANILIDL